jgi:hypothetical protein
VNRELAALVKKVWKKREDILEASEGPLVSGEDGGMWLIYDMYNGQNTAALDGPIPWTEGLMFLSSLAASEDFTQTAPELQSGTYWAKKDLGWVLGVYQSAAAAANTPPQGRTREHNLAIDEARKVFIGFLHYRHDQGAATQRVYVNVKPIYRAPVFKHILTEVAFGPKRIDGISNVKLAGPMDGGRVDTVLIYLADEDGAAEALERLRTYQKGPGAMGRFYPAVPKLTSPVKGLVGVSRASEPAQVRVVQNSGGEFVASPKGQSFGSYRAYLLLDALKAATGESDYPLKVEKFFRAGGLDPDNPGVQGALTALPAKT